MKRLLICLLALLTAFSTAFLFTACGIFAGNTSSESNAGEEAVTSDAVTLTFTGTDYTISDADACTVEGGRIVLTKPRIYRISGELSDGTIVVRVAKTDKVTLALDGLKASCSSFSVIYVESADKVTITTMTGTENTLSDGSEYAYGSSEDTSQNACIFSKDDLIFNGNGTLTVTGNYNHAVKCNDDLEIKSGKLIISAVGNALRGNDSVTISGGVVDIQNCKDGIKVSTTEATKEGKGFVTITGGSVTIVSSDDAIQSTIGVSITGGLVAVSAQGDVVNCEGTVSVADGCLIQLD